MEFVFQYGLSFYLHYLTRWPECFFVAENSAQRLMGYSKFELDLIK
jgi:ribosomal protein S18 acetylase RimI-like enzyme